MAEYFERVQRHLPAGVLLVVFFLVLPVHAQTSQRQGALESSFVVVRQGGYGVDYRDATRVDAEPAFGAGFRVGVNRSAHLNLSVQIDYAEIGQAITAYSDSGTALTVMPDDRGQWTAMIKGGWHLSASRFTPYVEAGIGAVMDYRGELSENTDTEQDIYFASSSERERVALKYSGSRYNHYAAAELGLGLRYEYSPSRFIRASISQRWVDTRFAYESQTQYVAQLEIGALLWD